MPIIKLQSSDGEQFPTDVEVAKCSGTIKTLLDDLGLDENDDLGVLPLPEVNAETLRLVLQWAEHHKNDPIPDDDGKKESAKDEISPWDTEFLKVSQASLIDLTLAANYLDIGLLYNSVCKTVANMLKGKSPDEIREKFHIPNDFSAEQKQKIREENEWCEKI